MTCRSLKTLLTGALSLPLVLQGQATPVASRFPSVIQIRHEDGIRRVSVSPNGRLMLFNDGKELRIRLLSSSQSTRVAMGSTETHKWSSGSGRIAWLQDGDVRDEQHVWTAVVDEMTGTLVSAAQRVSVGQGGEPAVSGNGQWIAYVGRPANNDGTRNLNLVPATGGPERVIARMGWFEQLNWSADGRSIYLVAEDSQTKESGIYKISLDGRAPAFIRPNRGFFFAGMTRDRTRMVFVPTRSPVQLGDSALVTDTTGRELHRAALPVGTGVQFEQIVGDSAILWERSNDYRQLAARPIAGGPDRLLPLIGESNEYPQWSPDGQRIAFQVIEGERNALAVMRADGTDLRVYRDVLLRADSWGFEWSPDSRLIAFSNKAMNQLQVLDVGQARVTSVLNDTKQRVGNWIWRDDSRALTVAVLNQDGKDGTIESVSLSGTRERSLPISSFIGRGPGFEYVSADVAFLRGDSGAFVQPLSGGPTRKLATVPKSPNAGPIAISRDRTVVATGIHPSPSEARRLELITLSSGQRTEVTLPFWFLAPYTPAFSPDGRTIYVAGRQSSDSTGSNVYAVRTDGSGSRPIVNLGTWPNRAGFSISPDGRSIVFTKQRNANAWSLLLVDLRPVAGGATGARRQ